MTAKTTKARKPTATLNKEISAAKATATKARKAAGRAVKAGGAAAAKKAATKARVASAKATRLDQGRKPTQTQSKPGMVPGWPTVKLYKGEGATDRSVAAVVAANRGADDVAVLNDGSSHVVSKFLGADIAVHIGDNYDACADTYQAAISAEGAVRSAKPKGRAVLARGAETEVHSRKAAADSRKQESEMTKTPAKKQAPAKKAAKANGSADRTYKVVNRDHGARPDSKRATQLAIVFKHTSTAKAKAAGAESVDFKFAADKGFIQFTK